MHDREAKLSLFPSLDPHETLPFSALNTKASETLRAIFHEGTAFLMRLPEGAWPCASSAKSQGASKRAI